MELTESVINRIKPYISISTNDCIEYPILQKDGYGQMQSYINNKKVHFLMHRVAYQVYYNDNLTSEDVICHKCDNPKCVNPKHLFKGTHKDNVLDKCKKGRQAKGLKNGRYIDGRCEKLKQKRLENPRKLLTKEQVLFIRELIKTHKLKDVAQLANTSLAIVKRISSKRSYKQY